MVRFFLERGRQVNLRRLVLGSVLSLAGLLFACRESGTAQEGLHTNRDHSLWDSILQESVSDGVVDYGKIKSRYADLQKYLQSLAKIDRKGLSRQERLTLEINAYNAGCINGVLSSGEIKSVEDVGRFFKKTKVTVGGEVLSLDALEHKSLRKLGEPRIHFAIVCASISCPPLISKAYSAEKLDEDLDRQLRSFLADESKNRLDRENGVFHLSKLFKWFREDFTRESSSVLEYIQPFLSNEDRDYVKSNTPKVKFLDYDWNLNGHF